MGLEALIWASNWDLGLEAGIGDSRMRFWPQEWDLGLKDRIWTLRLGFGPQSRIWVGGGTEKEKEKEKIPHMYESIGHRPLWGRCLAPPFNTDHQLLKGRVHTNSNLSDTSLSVIGSVIDQVGSI